MPTSTSNLYAAVTLLLLTSATKPTATASTGLLHFQCITSTQSYSSTFNAMSSIDSSSSSTALMAHTIGLRSGSFSSRLDFDGGGGLKNMYSDILGVKKGGPWSFETFGLAVPGRDKVFYRRGRAFVLWFERALMGLRSMGQIMTPSPTGSIFDTRCGSVCPFHPVLGLGLIMLGNRSTLKYKKVASINVTAEDMATLGTPVISLPRHPPTVNNDLRFPTQPLLPLIDQCTTLSHLKQVHAQMLKTSLFFDPYSASKLITAASLSPFSSLDYAHQVFDEIPEPNLFSWNALIRAYASSPDPVESIRIFLQMLDECNECPNKFTFPFLLKAASELRASKIGRGFHGMVSYKKDVVSWNSVITAFAQGNCPEVALELFKEMEAENMKPNDVTLVSVLSACAKMADLEFGRWVCSHVETHGVEENLTLNNAMLDMYVKCGSVEDAERLFGRMPEKDVVSWTTMLDGYARMGNYDEARRVFGAMPSQDIAAWNVLISSYEQNSKPKEALAVFHELQKNKGPKPDEVTLVCTLAACSQLGAIDLGGWIHVYVKKQGMKLNCHLTTSLIDMYAKCGNLEKALEVFNSAETRDIFVWSAMIAALAMHGQGRDALHFFSKMLEAKVKPNAVTFTNILCACSHAGLVNEGITFFNQMERVYGVVPGIKHYACMVDILGRSGNLEEAAELIEKMPICPTPSVWGALLGACTRHGNVALAEKACSHLLDLDPRNHGAYVLLSNVYAKTGKWEAVSGLRKLMRDSGIKKEPGCSSIEIDGSVHEFLVGDNTHPLSKDIYSKLDEIAGRLKSIGYVPNKSHLLQFVVEEDMKEHALILHSEKLAIAFGLISSKPSQPIRVVKNLRVCGDCHSVAKLYLSFIIGRYF
ncbi:hypothetical protein ACLB2K_031076 [Fragaria x ananassa]